MACSFQVGCARRIVQPAWFLQQLIGLIPINRYAMGPREQFRSIQHVCKRKNCEQFRRIQHVVKCTERHHPQTPPHPHETTQPSTRRGSTTYDTWEGLPSGKWVKGQPKMEG